MKLIDATKDVPYIYRTSRDYQAILRLLNILDNVVKNEIDNLPNFLDPDRCPSRYLPLLASYVGYDYDYTLTYDANRIIIKYYPEMIKNRGSEEGIMLACAVALNISGILVTASQVSNYVNLVYITNLQGERELVVYINKTAIVSKLYDLIEIVRPAGLGIGIHPSISVRPSDKVHVEDSVTIVNDDASTLNRDKIMENNPTIDDDVNTIGFGQIEDE